MRVTSQDPLRATGTGFMFCKSHTPGEQGEVEINISQFCTATESAFNRYFSDVSRSLSAGQIRTAVLSAVPSFPQMIIVTTLPNHFAIELVGGRRCNRELKIVKRNLNDPNLFFSQFNYPPDAKYGIHFYDSRPSEGPVTANGGIAHLSLIPRNAEQEIARRFPQALDQYLTNINIASEDAGPVLGFPAGARYYSVEDTLLANAYNGAARIRHIRFALIVANETSIDDYKSHLAELLTIKIDKDVVAMHFLPPGKAEKTLKVAQFANIFLMNKLHETSIGSFIDQHQEILLSALKAQQLISEPYVPWMVPSPDPEETAINPDLFVQRTDGYWDVYDLKLALLNRKDLTTGRRRRKKFVETIEDGMAQLAHYREFFSIPEHAEFTQEKYNVTFSDPRFILVVGNYENADPHKIADARRRFPDLQLIDYDSLLQLYLINENAFPVQVEKSPATQSLS